MDLREVGYDDRDWINLAQDRDQWRAYLWSYGHDIVYTVLAWLGQGISIEKPHSSQADLIFQAQVSLTLNQPVYYQQMVASIRVILTTKHQLEAAKGSLPSKETLRGHSDSSFRGEGYIQCFVGVRLCDMYSNQGLAEIHFMYGKADGNAALARRLYQEK
ncbi:hypothetical protein ANN_12709 [Periplaneta americana]|uniref:Uncharacterized protein n=1 Tax=Periplaneta americana TaxID=6978 RepID=A0ABQ8THA7_PERAM|nr:hypothetical protein ANN_12709 [Periplaneta americana]